MDGENIEISMKVVDINSEKGIRMFQQGEKGTRRMVHSKAIARTKAPERATRMDCGTRAQGARQVSAA